MLRPPDTLDCGLRHKTDVTHTASPMQKKKIFEDEINFCPSVRKVGLENRILATVVERKARTICIITYYHRVQGGQRYVRINTVRNSCLRMVRLSPLILLLPVADIKLKMLFLRYGAV